ncbi:hypothetical protein ACIRJS_36310 [Streptomyces sp. NPDC102340]|uniref:hypothetical protein n=1 Tax=unclassified Streptomyces TaxID=2593676 RepID=UPI003830589A
MFEIRVICDDTDADRVRRALNTAFQTYGRVNKVRTHDGKRVRLYVDADHLPTAWPTPEKAYATAPSIVSEIGWTCARARTYARGTGADREYWLRKAALLDRIALTDAYSDGDASEAAVEAARQLLGVDENGDFPGGPHWVELGPDSSVSIADPRGYVRQEYAMWSGTHR